MPKMEKPMEKTRTYDATYDQIWTASINALTSNNQMITMSQKDSGVIGVDRDFTPQEIWDYVLIDGWNKFWTTWTAFHSRANFVVQPVDPQHTKVIVNTQIRGGEKKVDYNIWWGYATASNQERALTSNGKLEKEYLDMIEAQTSSLKKIAWINEKSSTVNPGVNPNVPTPVKKSVTDPTTAVVPVVSGFADPTVKSEPQPEAKPTVATAPVAPAKQR